MICICFGMWCIDEANRGIFSLTEDCGFWHDISAISAVRNSWNMEFCECWRLVNDIEICKKARQSKRLPRTEQLSSVFPFTQNHCHRGRVGFWLFSKVHCLSRSENTTDWILLNRASVTSATSIWVLALSPKVWDSCLSHLGTLLLDYG